jgi:hypothetical protein
LGRPPSNHTLYLTLAGLSGLLLPATAQAAQPAPESSLGTALLFLLAFALIAAANLAIFFRGRRRTGGIVSRSHGGFGAFGGGFGGFGSGER